MGGGSNRLLAEVFYGGRVLPGSYRLPQLRSACKVPCNDGGLHRQGREPPLPPHP
eukprot:CAMPEP_0180269902 /NCGR_PEP_ID=MMETSP0988-20121125/2900_1 /TAXON_ID=697907 /ORGANISM="non described non described, Strain CCMP2293" /LENGTH=54 /DNA_ID=CAMNT_0022240819 /DNA_START=1758 /DNA_END=1919 /DNA_ORIENTATION=+